jgi:hypothetical protein
MKLAMDEISFERGGTEVHMRKKPAPEQRTCASPLRVETLCDNSRMAGNSSTIRLCPSRPLSARDSCH